MQIGAGDLTTLSYGDGDDLTIFVDPLCGACKELLSSEAMDELIKNQRVHVVPIAALGSKSQPLVEDLLCSTRDSALKALRSADFTLLQRIENCRADKVKEKAEKAVQVIGVVSVPLTIRSDGAILLGNRSDSLVNWASRRGHP
jgi:hypothetical protein